MSENLSQSLVILVVNEQKLKFLVGLRHNSQEETVKSSEIVEHLQRSRICMARSLCLKCVYLYYQNDRRNKMWKKQ